MNKKLIPLVVFASIAFGYVLALWFIHPEVSTQNQTSKNKINKLLEYINRDYFEEVKTDSIVDLTVNEILAKLDPHSVYINKADALQSQEQMRGDFVGIGINFYQHKDTVVVIKNIENGPAEKAGILPGDRILFAEKKQLFGSNIKTDTLFKYLKGEENSTVNLTIYRKSLNKTLIKNVKRQTIPLKSIETSFIIKPQVGYIKVNRFAESTYTEFKKALDELVSQNVSTLIIDLRDNSGGYIEVASKMIDEFLDEKQIIVKTKNKNGQVDITYATKKGGFLTGKLFVLVNENSASASEIFAGAIQDNDRGTIVGRRTFGKGLVQKEMSLGDGSLVRLTVAKYYTPSGRSIQKPFENGKNDDYYNMHSFNRKELFYKDSIKTVDSLKYKTTKGRIVYGGGGIIPDIFVPLNKKFETDHVLMMLNNQNISYFIFDYLDKNRTYYHKLKLNDIKKEVYQNDKIFQAFVKYFSENNAAVSKNLSTHQAHFQTQLYAELTRQLFDEQSYYQILLENDDMLKEILSNE